MKSSGIAIERRGPAWTIALDRADRMNALSAAAVDALTDAVDEAIDGGAALLVLKGNGRNFSAGFDFGDLDATGDAELLARFVGIEMLLQRIDRATLTTVALAHGRNFGAGVDLFAVCQHRIAAPGTTFRMPGLAFGLQLGTRRFARIVGRDVARRILSGLETFDAARALDIGFIDRIAEMDEWLAIVAALEASAAALPAESRALCHRALDDGEHDRDLADLVRSAAVPGLRERIRAYVAAQSAARAKRPAGSV